LPETLADEYRSVVCRGVAEPCVEWDVTAKLVASRIGIILQRERPPRERPPRERPPRTKRANQYEECMLVLKAKVSLQEYGRTFVCPDNDQGQPTSNLCSEWISLCAEEGHLEIVLAYDSSRRRSFRFHADSNGKELPGITAKDSVYANPLSFALPTDDAVQVYVKLSKGTPDLVFVLQVMVGGKILEKELEAVRDGSRIIWAELSHNERDAKETNLPQNEQSAVSGKKRRVRRPQASPQKRMRRDRSLYRARKDDSPGGVDRCITVKRVGASGINKLHPNEMPHDSIPECNAKETPLTPEQSIVSMSTQACAQSPVMHGEMQHASFADVDERTNQKAVETSITNRVMGTVERLGDSRATEVPQQIDAAQHDVQRDVQETAVEVPGSAGPTLSVCTSSRIVSTPPEPGQIVSEELYDLRSSPPVTDAPSAPPPIRHQVLVQPLQQTSQAASHALHVPQLGLGDYCQCIIPMDDTLIGQMPLFDSGLFETYLSYDPNLM
jgi:hypothetical protein